MDEWVIVCEGLCMFYESLFWTEVESSIHHCGSFFFFLSFNRRDRHLLPQLHPDPGRIWVPNGQLSDPAV